jgi:hypothetical protein
VAKAGPELLVICKAYDLVPWSCHHTGRFPRNHRFVPGERIERHLYDLLETLVKARYTSSLSQPSGVLVVAWQTAMALRCSCRSRSPHLGSGSRSPSSRDRSRKQPDSYSGEDGGLAPT